MGTVFQLLGIIFLIILVVVVLAVFLIRRKLKAIAKALSGYDAQPSEVHLTEELRPAWVAEPSVQSMIEELTSLGFARGKAYGIEEMPQVKLCSFFRANPAIVCALYQHDAAGNWVDLVVKNEDGTGITVTNAPTGEDLDTRPNSTKVFLKDADLISLCRELEKRIEHKETLPIDDTNFKEVFENSYKEDMEWRNKRGGVTAEEVRRIAQKMDGEYDDTVIAEAVQRIKSGELYQLHEDCIENFARLNPELVEENGNGRDALFLVSDHLDAASYVGYLGTYLDLPDKLFEQLERLSKLTKSARVLFMKANGTLPKRSRATKIGSVSSPIDAEIYRSPLEV